LSNHLRLGLPSGLLPSGFPTNIASNYKRGDDAKLWGYIT
jgi:hypothetical protein